MKIAIAASGVGHVFRGMEGWCESIAETLSQRGVDVTLFRGAGPKKNTYDVCIPCLKRTSKLAKLLSKFNSIGGWRVGLGSPGQIEAWSYGLLLLWKLRKGFDLVHIKQGNLANFLKLAQSVNILRIPFVLSNGQIAKPSFISKFKFVQFLSPYEKKQMEKALGECKHWFVIPNFVDTDKFSPLSKENSRRELKIPLDSFVILTVGAIKRYHKRMDYFLEEMGRLKNAVTLPIHIIIAGSRDRDTEFLIKRGKELLGKNLTVLTNLPKDSMPTVYNAADVFTLCSLQEAFGNVYIEAMSCGLPVIHHCYPVTEWITGDGGESGDLRQRGALCEILMRYIKNSGQILQKSVAGRKRAIAMFSKEIILSETIQMYKTVIRSHDLIKS